MMVTTTAKHLSLKNRYTPDLFPAPEWALKKPHDYETDSEDAGMEGDIDTDTVV